MMGGKTSETCWTVNKRQDNKLENCCIWLVIYLNSQIYFGMKQYMFRTVPLSIIGSFSLYTQQWYTSYRFADSCQQTCMTYTIAVCTVKNSRWWTEELSETCTVSFQNKFENSNKSPTRYNNFPVYYPDVYLQFNMFRTFSRPSSGAQWLQWQPLVLPIFIRDIVL